MARVVVDDVALVLGLDVQGQVRVGVRDERRVEAVIVLVDAEDEPRTDVVMTTPWWPAAVLWRLMFGLLPPFDGPMQMQVASLLSVLRVSSWCQARTSTPSAPFTTCATRSYRRAARCRWSGRCSSRRVGEAGERDHGVHGPTVVGTARVAVHPDRQPRQRSVRANDCGGVVVHRGVRVGLLSRHRGRRSSSSPCCRCSGSSKPRSGCCRPP